MVAMVVERGTKATATPVGTPEAAMPLLLESDILCTDLDLKAKQNGLDLAAAFKKKKPWGQVILLSGGENPKSPHVDQVLRKPAFPEAIQQAAKKAIREVEKASDPLFLRTVAVMAESRKQVARARALKESRRDILDWFR